MARRDYIIYIIHGGDAEVRYVGMSVSLPNLTKNAQFMRWARDHKRVVIEIIEEGLAYWQATRREKYWINKYSKEGADLFNVYGHKPVDKYSPPLSPLEKLRILTSDTTREGVSKWVRPKKSS